MENKSQAITGNPYPKEIEQAFLQLIESIKSKGGEVPNLIFQAMDMAYNAHLKQQRKDGTPYISHPIAVAQIICDMNMPPLIIAAGLLHDVVEDCSDKGFTIEKIEAAFGKEMSTLIQSVTKVSLAQKKIYSTLSSKERKEYEADETMKKLIISLADDSRAIIIKLADRLHNMRTLEYVPQEHKIRKSIETLTTYSPLASALGFNKLKSELDDICFRHKLPEEHKNISRKLKLLTQKNKDIISSAKEEISSLLKNRPDIPSFSITSRTKSAYGIFRKMRNNNLLFESIYDIFGFRIVYEASHEEEAYWAWRIFAEIASKFRQKEDRIRDFILKPRNLSGYQSLHLTILHPSIKAIEIQIRSQRMHANAELGGANHYDYKNKRYHKKEDVNATLISKKISSIAKPFKEALISGDTSTLEVSQEFYRGNQEMVVYTHTDEYKTIAKGASVLDFAFKVHSDLLRCFDYALVNGKKVDASYILQPYEKISIMKKSSVTINALSIRKAQLSSTRSEIRKTIRREKEKIIQLGEIKLRRYLRILFKNKLGKKTSFFDVNQDSISRKMAHYFGLHQPSIQSSFGNPVDELYYKIEKSIINRENIIAFVDHIFSNRASFINKYILNFIPINRSPKKPFINKLEPINTVLFGPTREIKNYNIAHCCRPIVGDEIKAVEHFDHHMVHKKHCEKHPRANTVSSAVWDHSENASFFVEIAVRSHNNKNTLKNLLSPIYTKVPNILSLNSISVGRNHHLSESYISFTCPNHYILKSIIQKIEKLSTTKSIMITSKSE